ncbi:hypothetical protein BDY21DRAFT_280333 [Lineolata rhizophorae]|uniref:Rhodopsin domain-containing protein n=1 Tax=Lineolata rhizophorae TaxID=578093 RepID=A0A6A6PA33_9PEZI|nr:hypothetical protein BDY21DRAFT_280333 [Lineolata rhizophorae]
MLGLRVESWVWYAVVLFVATCRYVSRIMLLGNPMRLQVDDWIMLLAIASYTTLIVTINIVADSESNLLPPHFPVESLTPEDIDRRAFGSKITLVVEQCQCVTIWAVKACVLIMYYRVTYVSLYENLTVKILAVYVAVSFVVMEVLYLGVWCRPFSNYWAVPTPNSQCNTALNHLIVNAVFNISSDAVMLTMAFQMILKSHLPIRRKLILCGIFGLGVFVILSASLNKYHSFAQPYGAGWTFWYVREASTAMLVGNIPYTWNLLRRMFNLNAFDQIAPPAQEFHSQRTARARHHPRSRDGPPKSQQQQSNSNDSSVDSQDAAHGTVPLRKWKDRNLFGKADRDALEPIDTLELASPTDEESAPMGRLDSRSDRNDVP